MLGEEVMVEDRQLLRRYATEGSEAAFGQIVDRYVNLVYSAALRRTSGDTQLAQDVVQLVFTDLARKARSLPSGVVLAGWLHGATRFASAQLLRSEHRRHAREQEALAMNTLNEETTQDWEQVRPMLDAALDRLPAMDRDAVLLRFFGERSLGEVGRVLGLNEDAARKRVSRALEKLREELVRRGVATAAGAFASALAANAVQVAPAGLAATVTSASLAGVASSGGILLTMVNFMAMTKMKAALIGAIVAAGVATPLVIQHRAEMNAREQDQALRQETERLAQLTAENERLSNQLAQATASPPLADAQLSELLRLRSEVANQRAAPSAANAIAPPAEPPAQDPARLMALAAAQGDPAGLAKLIELGKAADANFKTNRAGLTNQALSDLARKAFAPLNAAFETLTEEAAKGAQPALQILSQAILVPELRGAAVKSLGVLAGRGNQSALDILLDGNKYDIPLSSVVGALRPAAENGEAKAVEALAAVAADPHNAGLWYMTANALAKPAESGNAQAIEALIAIAGSTNQYTRLAALSGLTRSAANQHPRAVEAMRQMQGP